MSLPISRIQKFLMAILLVLPILSSCDSGKDTSFSQNTELHENLVETDNAVDGLGGPAKPGIYESSGFFPVDPKESPQRFIVIGDMGGPVLYSSGTMPAWLVGNKVFMISADGKLTSLNLSQVSSEYLPPDMVAFSGSHKNLDPQADMGEVQKALPEELASNIVQGSPPELSKNMPTSVSVTGVTSAVWILDNKELFTSMGGTRDLVRQFDSELNGPVLVCGSPQVIVLNDSYGKILAMDPQSATTLWESNGGPVLLSGGMAIYAGQDSTLQIHDANSGQLMASSDLAGFSMFPRPSRDASSIFAVQVNGSLAALDYTGKTKWIAETNLNPLALINDQKQILAISTDELAAFDKNIGSELWRLDLPVPPAGDPVILPDSILYAGTDGKVYASVPDQEPSKLLAADPGERITAVISFRLEKYIRSVTDRLLIFAPYVEEAAHEGPMAFTVFAYGPVEIGGEYWFSWEGEDRDVVLALFNAQGDELRANLDEFGTHDTFSYRLDEKGLYYIALGRQEPSPANEALFLSVIPARRN